MAGNWIYTKTTNNKARFVLGEPGKKTLICIGINPSTATPEKLDNTLATVKRFSIDLGYDSWIMLNVYPQRATNPDNMHLHCKKEYHEENLKELKEVFAQGDCDIWAAWGTLIEKRSYLSKCLKDIYAISQNNSLRWHTIGKRSIKGHPHHPLYLSKHCRPEEFDVEAYLEAL